MRVAVVETGLQFVKIDPARYSFQVAQALDLDQQRTDVRTMTKRFGGVAGINGSFFDDHGAPLGLVIRNGQTIRHAQLGGNLLTGAFFIADDKPQIANRHSVPESGVVLALQAGPRLIADGEPIMISSTDGRTRRSGIAITNSGEVLFYATVVRFPGATLEEIQKTLLLPGLNVRDALNFDGGGSSQLFVETNNSLQEEINISGGDNVPLALIVKLKKLPSVH